MFNRNIIYPKKQRWKIASANRRNF